MIIPLLKSLCCVCQPLERMKGLCGNVHISSMICRLQCACYRSRHPVGTKYHFNLNGGRKCETVWQSSEVQAEIQWMAGTATPSAVTKNRILALIEKVTSMKGLNVKQIILNSYFI